MNATSASQRPPVTWQLPALLGEPIAWLGTSGPDGQAALVPAWFAWDGEAFLVATKPGARKARNIAANPKVMLGIVRLGARLET